MATTTGLVQQARIAHAFNSCCVRIGPSPSNTTLFFILRVASDSAARGDLKLAMMKAIISAQATRREVSVDHTNTGGEITAVRLGP